MTEEDSVAKVELKVLGSSVRDPVSKILGQGSKVKGRRLRVNIRYQISHINKVIVAKVEDESSWVKCMGSNVKGED